MDEIKFSTGGYVSGSGNDLITVQELFHVEGTIGYKFNVSVSLSMRRLLLNR
jgi:hypothetical protein